MTTSTPDTSSKLVVATRDPAATREATCSLAPGSNPIGLRPALISATTRSETSIPTT